MEISGKIFLANITLLAKYKNVLVTELSKYEVLILLKNLSQNRIYPILKRIAVFAVKVGISAALIIWLLKKNRLDFSIIKNLDINRISIELFICGSSLVFFGLLLLSLRLYLLLRFKNFSVSYSKVLGITFLGSFLGVVLPGLVGGDVVKAVYLCSNVSKRRMDALTSVVLDRFLGLYSLLLLGALIICIEWILNSMPFDLSFLLFTPIIVVLVGIILCLMGWDGFFNLHIIQILNSMLPRKVEKFIVSIREYLKSPGLIIKVILLSLFNHTLIVCTFIVAAFLLKDGLPLSSYFIIDPLAMVMNAVPITPGGLGITESAFSFLFQAAGSSNGAIVGLLGRCIQYIVFIFSGSIALSFLKMKSQIFALDPIRK